MSINAFTVVSEFKFDVAGAILGADALTNKVNALDSAVQNALGSVKALGVGFIANFTGASAGIIGVLGNAVSMSDKFTQSQLSFVQIIDSNMAHLDGTINNINEQMMTSKKIMNDIAKDARKFGLPADELLSMTKTLTAMLVPKGLAGDNFGAARGMSRNLLKSAPNLGINPADVQGQLLRSIEGSASMGDTLFRRLITEAPEPFKEAKIKDAKGFNALDAATRFNILNESLAKFANNAKILEMRANTLSGVMQSAGDLFRSFNSVLKPLGDVLMPVIVQVFQLLIKFIDNQGRAMVEAFARFLKPMIDGPKEMLLNFMSLDNLSRDIARSAGIVSLIIMLIHFQEALTGLGRIPILSKIVTPLQSLYDFILGFPVIGNAIKSLIKMFDIGKVSTFSGVIKALALTLGRMFALFGVFLIPILGFTKALSMAKIEALEWLGNNLASIIDLFTSLKNSFAIFMAPIMDMIDGWAELFFIIIGGTSSLDSFKSGLSGLATLLDYISTAFLYVYAAGRAWVAGILSLFHTLFGGISELVKGFSSGGLSGLMQAATGMATQVKNDGADEFMKTIDRFRAPTLNAEGEENAKVVNAVNNYDVTMNNSFKEVLQPDRIAFTIQDQLQKASQNRTSARGFSSAATQARSI